MEVRAQHLHTYFLFPFSVDREAVMVDQPAQWAAHDHWFDGVDEWMTNSTSCEGSAVIAKLGRWQRDSFTRFDLNSPAYQSMVFFHPFVRRVFFDTANACGEPGQQEALLHSFNLSLAPLHENGRRLMFEARDSRGRSASIEVTELDLIFFANGIGILTIGVEALNISAADALWINEMMRKVYPSSGRQLREGRTPNQLTLVIQRGQEREVVLEEDFTNCAMRGYLPPLSRTISGLLYFADYTKQQFEPVLDERMIVYTYLAVDPKSVEPDYDQSEEYEILLSRLLYVDRWGESYRYEADFTREQMRRQVYRRWAHQGTLYGFSSYSNITMVMGEFDCDEHQLREGFLVHRMFCGRYLLTTIVALFYRATLLDFSERTALVSRSLFKKFGTVKIDEPDIRLAQRLMADFQFFANYWLFSELANKDEEIEHFELQCQAYRLGPMKAEIELEIEKLSEYMERFYQLRNTEAVNRLAMLSMILGGGAVITGFFGMNFGRDFEKTFFNPTEKLLYHDAAIILVSGVVVASLAFAVYLVVAGWRDYRSILVPGGPDAGKQASLRRTPNQVFDQE